MSKQKNNNQFKKKYAYEFYKDEIKNEKYSNFQTPIKYNTLDYKGIQQSASNTKFSIKSSRIADQTQYFPSNKNNIDGDTKYKYRQPFIDAQDILQKKERQIYFLNIQLQNYDLRLQESEEIQKCQMEQILRLRQQIQNLLSQNNQFNQKTKYFQETISNLQGQNTKLKQEIQILLQQKNEILKQDFRKSYSSVQNSQSVHFLKRQVQDLKIMINQMEHSLKNCPNCYALKRQVQELTQAYDNIQKMYKKLNFNKLSHEKDMLKNITVQIQQNQNILRENQQLKDKRPSSNMKNGRQKFKQSVAKRCRTLTDQF